MSRIRADKLVNRVGSGGPKFPNGVADGFSVSGIVTATSFSGPLTGNVTGNASGTAGSLAAGATGSDLTLSGNLTVNGTTTTIDTAVTAVDSLAVDGNITSGGTVAATYGTFGTSGNCTITNLGHQQWGGIPYLGQAGVFNAVSGVVYSCPSGSSNAAFSAYSVGSGTPTATILGNGNFTTTGNITSGGDVSIADKIVHTDDPNTAIRFPAADTFTVETTGNERLRIDSAGDLIQGSSTSFWQKNGNNRLLISSGESTPTVYVSDSGNDSTGDGTTSNPFRTLTKAWNYIPRVYSFNHSPRILIKGTSYTVDTTHYCRGGGSGGNWQYGPAVDIKSESGSQIDVYLRSTLLFESIDGLRFQNLNFICDASGGHLSFTNCQRGKIYPSCDMNVTATGGWSYRIQYIDSTFRDEMDVAVASTASSGLGAIVTLYNSSCDGTRSFTKAGSQFGNAAVAVVNRSILTGGWSVDNFNTGIRLGHNHYGAETGGVAMLNGVTISNCSIGLHLYNNSFVRKFNLTYTNNTTNETSQTGSFTN